MPTFHGDDTFPNELRMLKELKEKFPKCNKSSEKKFKQFVTEVRLLLRDNTYCSDSESSTSYQYARSYGMI